MVSADRTAMKASQESGLSVSDAETRRASHQAQAMSFIPVYERPRDSYPDRWYV